MPNREIYMAIGVAVARSGGVEKWIAMKPHERVDAIFAELTLMETTRRDSLADRSNHKALRQGNLAWAE
jgi:hypothetical protein